jgi:pyruvate kinase
MQNLNKSTKIVATIGPVTDTEELIEQLITEGMNVARFNTKHGTPEWHQERMLRVRAVAKRMGVAVGILLDLQGPEIRLTIPGGEAFSVENNQEVLFTSDPERNDPRIPVIPQVVIEALQPGNNILVDDGLGEFEVKRSEGNLLTVVALGNFTVGNRKTLNTPGVVVEMPSLIPEDLVHLDAANNEVVDIVGLSFVRDGHDIAILRSELQKRNLSADICAKIENQSALDHLEEVINAADSVMVARGDLAVEVPFQELTYWQKKIIHSCREKGKPVITATQMLKSMVDHPRPTRAEVSDVANAVYDGTDAIMLSEETTIGKYPVRAVKTQRIIANFNEQHTRPNPLSITADSAGAYISHAAISLLDLSLLKSNNLQLNRIICLTETGETAKLIARFRPHVPIHALTSTLQTYQKLSLVYSVTPHIIDLPEENRLESSDVLLSKMVERGITSSGETVLLVHGTFWKKPGLTNTVSILQIP